MTSPTSPTSIVLTGEFAVGLPPAEAFVLFTPRGEENWAAGWRPRFPARTEDDAAPGTVFVVDGGRNGHHGPTTWVVTGRDEPRCIRYAQFVPGQRAGTVTVRLTGQPGGTSRVTVTYRLTALDPAGEPAVLRFAAGYPAFLDSWREAIDTATRTGFTRSRAPLGHSRTFPTNLVTTPTRSH